MIDSRIELCDGLIGFFDEFRNMYVVKVPWLGRKVEFWLSSSDYESEEDIEGLKKAFEIVYTGRDEFLSKGKNCIREKLLPYLASCDPEDDYVSYPRVSVDDFDANYWLTDVFVFGGFGMDSVQFNFNPEDDDERSDEIGVNIYLDSYQVEYYAGSNPIADDEID